MARKGKTEISIVLDRSGSMHSVVKDTIGGFNTFLEEQKKGSGKVVLTLAQFDYEYEVVHDAVDIEDVPNLTTETFVPRGSTALLDAIGRTVSAAKSRIEGMDEDDQPEKVIFVILTDGGENASKEFDRAGVFSLIKTCQDDKDWDFIFLGANQDAIKESAKYGIQACNTMSYAGTGKGTVDAIRGMSSNVTAYRATGEKVDLNFSDDQRKEQEDEMENEN